MLCGNFYKFLSGKKFRGCPKDHLHIISKHSRLLLKVNLDPYHIISCHLSLFLGSPANYVYEKRKKLFMTSLLTLLLNLILSIAASVAFWHTFQQLAPRHTRSHGFQAIRYGLDNEVVFENLSIQVHWNFSGVLWF